MSQIMVTVAPAAFYYALNHNSRRRPLIASACASGEEIMLAISTAFHNTREPATHVQAVRSGNGVSPEHRDRLSKFYAKHAIIRLAADGLDHRGGYVILLGELVGFHHIDTDHGVWMLQDAIANGARSLNCFDVPHLIKLYSSYGFREVRREPNHVIGQPDVVFMERVA